jgi:uncharacterized protein (DUF2336 family)
LFVAKSLGLGDTDAIARAESLSNEVAKMLTAFIQKLTIGISKKKLEARS